VVEMKISRNINRLIGCITALCPSHNTNDKSNWLSEKAPNATEQGQGVLGDVAMRSVLHWVLQLWINFGRKNRKQFIKN